LRKGQEHCSYKSFLQEKIKNTGLITWYFYMPIN
jgi:hypothetical protein